VGDLEENLGEREEFEDSDIIGSRGLVDDDDDGGGGGGSRHLPLPLQKRQQHEFAGADLMRSGIAEVQEIG